MSAERPQCPNAWSVPAVVVPSAAGPAAVQMISVTWQGWRCSREEHHVGPHSGVHLGTVLTWVDEVATRREVTLRCFECGSNFYTKGAELRAELVRVGKSCCAWELLTMAWTDATWEPSK